MPMCPASDPIEQDETLIETRFRAALITPYGPADLCTALRTIAPLLLEARALGVSWLYLSKVLSKVRLEIQSKSLSDATLRGVMRKAAALRPRPERPPATLLGVLEPVANAPSPRPEQALLSHCGIPPPSAESALNAAAPEVTERRARLRAQRERLRALSV
jgi:hypothetical protein